MKSTKFFQKGYFRAFFLMLLLAAISNCSKNENSTTSNQPKAETYTLNIDDPAYAVLKQPDGSITYKDVVIAYDAYRYIRYTCAESTCPSCGGSISYHPNGSSPDYGWICTSCNSEFEISGGGVVKGPSTVPLVIGGATLTNGNILTILIKK